MMASRSGAKFQLTRQAAMALRDVHAGSAERWGQKTADAYLAEMYAVAVIKKAASRPEMGQVRGRRSAPFLMIPAGRHFVIYDRLNDGIVILTLLHQHRDIEPILADLKPDFLAEIARLRKNKFS